MRIASFTTFFQQYASVGCVVLSFCTHARSPHTNTHTSFLQRVINAYFLNYKSNRNAQTILKLTKRHMTLNLVNKIIIFLFIYDVQSLYSFIYTNIIQVLWYVLFCGQKDVNRRVPGPNCMEFESRFSAMCYKLYIFS